MGQKNDVKELKVVRNVEVSGVFNFVVSAGDLGTIQEVLNYLRVYGDAVITAIEVVG